jgi:hypothetical protein
VTPPPNLQGTTALQKTYPFGTTPVKHVFVM